MAFFGTPACLCCFSLASPGQSSEDPDGTGPVAAVLGLHDAGEDRAARDRARDLSQGHEKRALRNKSLSITCHLNICRRTGDNCDKATLSKFLFKKNKKNNVKSVALDMFTTERSFAHEAGDQVQ